MDEFQNPARKYKWFRPRQATIASRQSGLPVNRATLALFNNSSGPQLLVVRDIIIQGTAGDAVAFSYVQGQTWTAAGVQQKMILTDGIDAGTIGSVDTATAFTQFYTVALANGVWFWVHDYPFAIIPLGYSLVAQCLTVAHATNMSVIFEALAEDQIDFAYPLWPSS